MGFTCGIIGLPNVGKTTIFNALTQAGAETTNYAFSSSQPNLGVVQVPDKRLDAIGECIKADNTVYTTLEFVDIAGLVKGASRGEGLGNKFLAHIREVDAIAHIVRCFENQNVAGAGQPAQPVSDIEEVQTELLVADLETLEKRKQKIEKLAKSGDAEARTQKEILERLIGAVDNNQQIRHVPLQTEAEKAYVHSLNLLTVKPVLYVCNLGDPSDEEKDFVKDVEAFGKKEGAPVVSLAGALENEIQEIDDPEEQQILMEEMGIEGQGLGRIIEAGYNLLDLVTFYTAGGKENRAWTVRAQTKAPRAAGKIHSDIEKGFIRAEVYHFDDLMKHKTEQAIKEAGLMRLEGKEYILKDGDILHFRFNV